MNNGRALAGVVVAGGAWYLLTRTGALAGSGLGLDDLGIVRHEATPEETARALALRVPAAGNAPIAPSSSFIGSGGIGALAGVGVSALPLLGIGGVALGITTAGIGLAIAFISYELLKQRASMHTNDVRDQWTGQFIALHDALGITRLRADQTAGSGPGSIEMAEVIFYFDHDGNNTLWKAVTKTQDERTFRAAAGNVDRFLGSYGVPVQDVA